MESKVIYIGKTNDYTFRENIKKNSKGTAKKIIDIEGREIYRVDFENGINVTIDKADLYFITN